VSHFSQSTTATISVSKTQTRTPDRKPRLHCFPKLFRHLSSTTSPSSNKWIRTASSIIAAISAKSCPSLSCHDTVAAWTTLSRQCIICSQLLFGPPRAESAATFLLRHPLSARQGSLRKARFRKCLFGEGILYDSSICVWPSPCLLPINVHPCIHQSGGGMQGRSAELRMQGLQCLFSLVRQ